MTVYSGTMANPIRDRLRGPQVHAVVSAPSKAAAMRALGTTRSEFEWGFCETGNKAEIEWAEAHPGVAGFRPLDVVDAALVLSSEPQPE